MHKTSYDKHLPTSTSNKPSQVRLYRRSEVVVFHKTKEAFGGLSNMAAGYPLKVNNVRVPSTEALYQACRFPHLPQVQQEIISQFSPMTAKMKSKPHRANTRSDWNQVRSKIMTWCLRVKLIQHFEVFGALLLQTGNLPIVEFSNKDTFWGAKPIDEERLEGQNVLGRLLMQLREDLKKEDASEWLEIAPLDIVNFKLMGKPIEPVLMEQRKPFIQGSFSI